MVYNRQGLFEEGAAFLARCARSSRPVTLAVFDWSDLLEARKIYDTQATRQLIGSIVSHLQSIAGHGLVGCTNPAQFALLVPGGIADAKGRIAAVLGEPAMIELDGEHGEVVLVPSFVLEAVAHGGSVQEVHAQLCARLTKMNEEEQARLRYLRRAHERHSRPSPAPLADEEPRLQPRRPVLQMPATIQMPLSPR